MRLGEYLVQHNVIRVSQLESALRRQAAAKVKEPLGVCLIADGFISEPSLLKALSALLKVPYISDIKPFVSPQTVQIIDRSTAVEYDVVFGRVEGQLTLFFNGDYDTAKEICHHYGKCCCLAFSTLESIRTAILSSPRRF